MGMSAERSKAYYKEYYAKNKEKQLLAKKEYYLKNKEALGVRNRAKYAESLATNPTFREDNNSRSRQNHAKSAEERHSRRKALYEANRVETLQKRSEYDKRRKRDNPLYKLAKSLRTRQNNALKAKNLESKSVSGVRHLGCTIAELRNHIESKFKPGMTWDNWTTKGWHIDHVLPLSGASTIEEMIALAHYTNLQPLWWDENLRKGNKAI